MQCKEVENLADFLNFSPVKLLLAVDPAKIMDIQQEIARYLDDDLTVVRTAAFYLEIIPSRINKGKGLRDVCAHLGVSLSDTVSFGDSENDIPMLVEAGCGIAMENAEEAVKSKADKVTLSNNQDGIAYAIENWLR